MRTRQTWTWLLGAWLLAGCSHWTDISRQEILTRQREIISRPVILRLQLDGRERLVVLPRSIDGEGVSGQDMHAAPTLRRFAFADITHAQRYVSHDNLRNGFGVVGKLLLIGGVSAGVAIGVAMALGFFELEVLGAR